MKIYVDALISIFQIPFTLMGYTVTLQDIIVTLIFGGVICFIIGGLLK